MPQTAGYPLTRENQAFDVGGVSFFRALSGGAGIVYITADNSVCVRQTRDGWGWSRDGAMACVESGFGCAQDAAWCALNPVVA